MYAYLQSNSDRREAHRLSVLVPNSHGHTRLSAKREAFRLQGDREARKPQ